MSKKNTQRMRKRKKRQKNGTKDAGEQRESERRE